MEFVLFELPCGAWTMCRLRQRCRRRLCGLCLATMLVKPDGLVSPAAGCDIGHGMGGNGRRGVALLLNGGAGYDGRYAGGTLLLMQQARRCCCSQVLLLLVRHGKSRGCFLRFQPQLKRQRARVVAALPRCDGLKTCFSSFHHPLQPSSILLRSTGRCSAAAARPSLALLLRAPSTRPQQHHSPSDGVAARARDAVGRRVADEDVRVEQHRA